MTATPFCMQHDALFNRKINSIQQQYVPEDVTIEEIFARFNMVQHRAVFW